MAEPNRRDGEPSRRCPRDGPFATAAFGARASGGFAGPAVCVDACVLVHASAAYTGPARCMPGVCAQRVHAYARACMHVSVRVT